MASPEHLEILKKGTAPWNEWRAGNPELTPDLSGADLRRAARTVILLAWLVRRLTAARR